MTRRSAVCGWLLWLACPLVALAQDALPDEALVLRALLEQPEVRAAAARTQAAGADARALAAGPHEWTLMAAPTARRTDAGAHWTEWELQLGRSLRLPGKARLDRRIGAQGERLAGLARDEAVHRAARSLAAAWIDWLRAGSEAGVAQQQADLLREERDSVARRVALGDAAQRDLELLEAEHARAEADRLAAQAALQAAARDWTMRYPGIPLPVRLPALPEPGALDEPETDWRDRIVTRSHDIGIAEALAQQQADVAERARAERRPDPAVALRLLDEQGGHERAMGLVLDLPLPGRHRAALAERAAAQALAAEVEADGVRQRIEREAAATVAEVALRHQQWQAQHAAAQAQGAATARTRRAWVLGEVGLSEHLQARRAAHQSALAETRARVDALDAMLRLRIDAHALWHPEA